MKTLARMLPLALAAALLVAGCQSKSDTNAVTSLPEIKTVPPFSFTNYDGKVITNNDLKGDICVVSFFFTSCGMVCPTMNSTLNVLQSEFSNIPNFRIVSFDVDPETDNLGRIGRYAERYHAMPGRWYFLRNTKETVADLSSHGFMMGDIHQPMDHSSHYALVDTHGVIRGYYDALDKAKVDELRAAIKYLAGENG